MNPLAIGAGVGALAAAIFFGMWQWERASHKETLRDLDAETRRANVATTAANNNALKVKELEGDIALRDERAEQRAVDHARILAEKDAELQHTRQRMGAWKDAIENRPKVAERAMRAELNRRLRELSAITCRTDCASGNGDTDN